MKLITLNTSELNSKSTVIIGEPHLNLDKYISKRKTILVTDENVFSHYQDFINAYPHIIIGCGETVKNLQTVEKIVGELLVLGADRNTFLVGIGGGVVCDITGFVASIFMRGIQFGFVATSLLAQVDASVGGKNGVNLRKYKNMIGVFNTPEFVICDPEMLKTLPEREFKSGIGEVVKHALIQDSDFYAFLKTKHPEILRISSNEIEEMIHRSVQIKKKVVMQDFKEEGKRRILNFGHTLGHTIENNYDLTHGEAISIGMMFAAYLSRKQNLLTDEEVNDIKKSLKLFQLPTSLPADYQKLNEFLQKDKKRYGKGIYFVLLNGIGNTLVKKLNFTEINKHLEEYSSL